MAIIGIDLGTTNSVVCEYKKGLTHIIKIDGKDTIPSVVFFDNNNVEIGDKAKRRVLIHPDLTLCSMKRHIGTKHSQKIQGKKYTPFDSAFYILKYIKDNVEKNIGESITDAVITVPAYFNDQQRKDTREAAEKAGYKVLRLVPEPTAAAIAYGLDKEKDQMILVFDLGGGTFDVSILEVHSNNFTVKAVDGNSQLGGDDFDNKIVEFLNKWVEETSGKSIRGDICAQQKLKEEAEKIKIDLSQSKYTEIVIPDIVKGVSIDIEKFTRKEFKNLIQPYINDMIKKTKDVINSADISVDDVNRIVMVGGSSKNPIIQEMLTENFKQPYRADDMDTYVAQGAAIVCASLLSPVDQENKSLPVDLDFSDVISHSLGIEMLDDATKTMVFVPILKRNEKYPAKNAVIGSRMNIWQEEVRIGVFRGEEHLPQKNTRLGELKMEISPIYRGESIPLIFSCIFELDEDGILTFTAVEIPVDDTNRNEIQQIGQEHDQNQMVSYDRIKSLIDQYNFKSKKVEIIGGFL